MQIVDEEGHHLKNKNSGLFSSLKQYSTKCRVLLSGTPLQVYLNSCICALDDLLMMSWNLLTWVLVFIRVV